MRWLRAIAAALLLGALLYAAGRPVGPLPPLGSLLDPVHGVWAAARAATLPERATGTVAGLDVAISVVYDDRGVPHIFAQTEADAVRALGYVVARDRLFQLEIQARAAAGTLTELVGPAALAQDRFQRAIGLRWAAEREWAARDDTSRSVRLMRAYAAGVNAWIDDMPPEALPLEYRLLDARPLPWRPEYTLYVSRRMGYTLAYSSHEFRRRRVEELVGRRAADALFPMHSPIQEPIEPGPRERYPWVDTTPLPPPLTGGSGGSSGSSAAPPAARWLGGAGLPPGGVGRGGAGEAVGSNNWAVAPSRSASGHALLAGDPHLDLTLPSVWYEAHVVSPGGAYVYGVTIPGLPGIIIGFNGSAAWSFTNVGADVLDYYAEEFDDPEAPRRYSLDGAWRPLERRVEEFRGPDGALLAVDTVYHTHRGPVVRRDERPYSLRWTVLDAAGAVNVFADVVREGSALPWLVRFREYEAPAQNGLVADRQGGIAVLSAGWYPVRPGDGRGDRLQDGRTSAADWSGRWPSSRYPQADIPPYVRFPPARDSAQGYLASANQEPVDPAANADYLGVDWPAPWRTLRINQLLRADSSLTPDDMRRFQTDPRSVRADWFVAAFLAAVERVVHTAPADAELMEAAALLGEWGRRYTTDNRRAVLFEMAMDALEDLTWDELVPPSSPSARRIATPSEAVLYRLLHDPDSPWWDVRGTLEARETRDVVLAEALRRALRDAKRHHGDPGGDGWRWDRVQHANIYHLLRIPSFSALRLPVQGGPGLLNAVSANGTHGPSWRMVVELASPVRAWVTYPGGQSGNPVSPRYDDRIAQWVRGDLDSALVPRQPRDLAPERIVARLVLTARR